MKIPIVVDEEKKKLKDRIKRKKKFTSAELEHAVRVLAERL